MQKRFSGNEKRLPFVTGAAKSLVALKGTNYFSLGRFIITCPISYFITKVLQTHQMLIKLWFSFIYVSP